MSSSSGSVMDPYQVLKVLQDSGEFDKLRAEIFALPSIQLQFEAVQQRLFTELSSSPLLMDVPLKMRQARLPQIFNSFRLAVRKTSVANDIHSILWTVIHQMVPQIHLAIENATIRPRLDVKSPACPQETFERNYSERPDNAVTQLQDNLEHTGAVAPSPAKSDTICATTKPTPNEENDIKPTHSVDDKQVDNDSEQNTRAKSSKTNKRGRLVRLDLKTDKVTSRSTSDDEYVPALKKALVSSFTSPQEPISKRVEIWWPLDKCWYKGTVTAFRARDKKHHIRYDDNEIEWLDLKTERWRYD